MALLPLTVACGAYDRTRALADGRVGVEGADVRFIALEPEETFFRMAVHHEFDVAEMSLSTYVLSLFEDAPPFVAVPVFPSRMFRHGGVYVNADAGVREPAELAGRLVGLPEYQITAVVWVRGILAERHGLPLDAPRYRTGGLHDPGRKEKVAVETPPGLDIAPIPAGTTLASLLVEGELDAVYTPRMPRPYAQGDPRVRRLFPDVRGAERAYFEATGIFPIMHVLVIRREVYEANRWLARSLVKAFTQAKSLAEEELRASTAVSVMLPWLLEDLADTTALMGRDWWSYGLSANAETLRTFLRYSHEQHLAKRLLDPAELFAPESLGEVLI